MICFCIRSKDREKFERQLEAQVQALNELGIDWEIVECADVLFEEDNVGYAVDMDVLDNALSPPQMIIEEAYPSMPSRPNFGIRHAR